MEATAGVVTRWADSKERVCFLGESLRAGTEVHFEMLFVVWFGGNLFSTAGMPLSFLSFFPPDFGHSTNTLSALYEQVLPDASKTVMCLSGSF